MGWEADMAERLSRAVNGEKDTIIAEFSDLTGKSASALYRVARKHGFTPERKKRDDKGTLKSELTDNQVSFVSTLIQTTAREVKGCIMPVRKALQIAVKNGVIAPGQISVNRLQGILREREMNATALDSVTPSIRMASLHPNHVHVFDASICIQYYLKNGKGIRMMDERDFREKKPENFLKVKQRIIRMICADHFCHFIYPKYYLAAGENQRITYDFLMSVWRGGLHDLLPFRGVPFFLLMDAGSANIAKGLLNFFKRLEIQLPENMPHNPKRQGSAEVAQNIVERDFESGLRLEPATSMDELNAWAMDWCVYYNATQVHRRTQTTRTSTWLTITPEQLRELPSDEVCQMLYAEPEVSRIVRQDNTITFNNQDYRLKHIPGIRPKKEVMVIVRPYVWPKVGVMFNEQEYIVEPIGKLAGGFSADAAIIGQEYKQNPDTAVDRARKANENLAYGEGKRKKDDLPFGGTLQVMGQMAEALDKVVMMPKRGTPIEIDRAQTAQLLPVTRLLMMVRDALGGAVPPEVNRELRERYQDGIDQATAERVAAGFSSPSTSLRDHAHPARRSVLDVAPLRAAGGGA